MVDGCNFLEVCPHKTNALHTSTDRGQEKDVQQLASKHPKVFMAEEYFPHVDFASELLMTDWNRSSEIPAVEKSCEPKAVDVEVKF